MSFFAKTVRRPTPVEPLLAEARQRAGEERIAEAHSAFVAAAEIDSSGAADHEAGCFLLRIERPAEAVPRLFRALHAARRTADDALCAAACHNLAVAFRQMNRDVLAASYQQQSIAIRDRSRIDDPAGLACDLANLANDALQTGRYRLARQLLTASLAIERDRGSQEGEAADWGSLGLVAGLQGDFAEAVVCLGRAFRLHCRLNDRRGAAADLINFAWLCGRQGRWRAAGRCLRQALRRLNGVAAPGLTAQARVLLADAERIEAVRHRDPLVN